MSFSTTLSPGTLLQGGKYRIVKVLGQGGFGITYEAEQISLHRKVAVKEFFISGWCTRDKDSSRIVSTVSGDDTVVLTRFREKFFKEAGLMASLSHPHIAQILELFEENGTAYYVMEYCGGGSLEDKVTRDGPLPDGEARKYISEAGSALAYLHGRGIRHLDVKPANILFDAEGNVKLIDFGIAKNYSPGGSATSTMPGGYSRGFAPKEQYISVETSGFTPATDIYSLGATLYYLVTGKIPPEAIILDETPLDIPPHVPAGTASAIRRAMASRRQDRPQDVAAFLSLLSGTKGMADGTTALPRGGTAVNASADRTIVGTSADKTLVSKPGRRRVWPWIMLAAMVLAGAGLATWYLSQHHDTEVETPVNVEIAGEIPSDQTAPYIEVRTNPSGASIWIDGKDTGRRTIDGRSVILTSTDGLEVGKAVVFTFKKEGYEDFTAKPLTITEGQNDPRYAELKKQTTRLDRDGKDYILAVKGVEYRFISVPEGKFTMGATQEQTRPSDDELTLRSVHLSSYYIGKTEVTEALWKVVTAKSGSRGIQFPVTGINWNDCEIFIKELNHITAGLRPEGWRFDLPTEAQWEYAARGGVSAGTVYSGSDNLSEVTGETVSPAASFKPNRLGIYDMSGNVQEWCRDWYGAYIPTATENPAGPSSGSARVVRGGSASSGSAFCRVSCRSNSDPDKKYADVGFRLVLVKDSI